MLWIIESICILVFTVLIMSLSLIFNKNKYVTYASVLGSSFLFWSTIIIAILHDNYNLFNVNFLTQNFVETSNFSMEQTNIRNGYPPVLSFILRSDPLNIAFLISTSVIFFFCTRGSVESYFYDKKSLQKFLFLSFLAEGSTILAFLKTNCFYFFAAWNLLLILAGPYKS